MGLVGLVMGALLFILLPKEEQTKPREGTIRNALSALWTVGRNPQSILCGLIAGLLFIPTTIFDMIWGVRFLQEGARPRLCHRRSAIIGGSIWLDHRMSTAWVYLGSDRTAQSR